MAKIEFDLEELNQGAINDGLMLPATESFHEDRWSGQLGNDLTPLERRAYAFISNASNGPVSVKDVHDFVYEGECKLDDDKSRIWVLIARVRQKLGEKAIITVAKRKGYLSRRSLINQGGRPSLKK